MNIGLTATYDQKAIFPKSKLDFNFNGFTGKEWVCRVLCHLKLKNPKGDDRFTYPEPIEMGPDKDAS